MKSKDSGRPAEHDVMNLLANCITRITTATTQMVSMKEKKENEGKQKASMKLQRKNQANTVQPKRSFSTLIN